MPTPKPDDDFEEIPFDPAASGRMLMGSTPSERESAAQGARDKPGEAKAFVRGLGQGASLGFQDEIAGALESGFTGKPYTTARDESRAANAAAASEHPVYYGAGIGGSALLPIPGAGGASLARNVLTSTAMGGAAGLGASEADLTRGEFGPALRDTAIGAGLSGAISAAVGARMRSAENREMAGLVEDVNRGQTAAKKAGRVKLANLAGEDFKALKSVYETYPGEIRTIASLARGKPERGAEVATQLVGKIDDINKPMYAAINTQKGGIKLVDLVADIDKERRAFVAAGKTREGNALETVRKDLIANYGVDGKVPTGKKLPAETVRALASQAGDIAFAGDMSVKPSVRQSAMDAARRSLIGNIDKAAAGVEGVDLLRLKQNNKDLALLITMRDNMKMRAADAKGGGQALTTTIQNTAALGLGAISGALHGGGWTAPVVAGLAGPVALKGAKVASRLADRIAAGVTRASRNAADPASRAIARGVIGAAETGIPRVVGGATAGAVSRATRPGVEDDFEDIP